MHFSTKLLSLFFATASIAALVSGGASAATIGFTLSLSSGIESYMVLTNNSSSALLTDFIVTIGDEGYNFKRFTRIPFGPDGGTATPIAPDYSGVGINPDHLELQFDGFDPAESSTWWILLGQDGSETIDAGIDNIMFNNGNAPNSVATALFSNGRTLNLTLPDSDLALGYTFSASADLAAVPLPATLPLFAGGLGLMGLLSWRKRRRSAT